MWLPIWWQVEPGKPWAVGEKIGSTFYPSLSFKTRAEARKELGA